ncbi:type II toxin-antitoxin system RatA family toxin [Catenovulum sp. SM1970]|uniref:type II toxin-antitoxin system RatA family toxin n=1 Tax=Marinifaba aquimaris TaxID=2741323 RepID=UPI00157450D9|nr:type II toxin-antitoxin system RatA family toxin [Marinifaba aquimaris]NTS75584.1 type II toxin-antitoxin system RatA family toxin [Marinifaba aquimaris]
MPTIQRDALVMHSAETMFDLVNDVSAYPEFLPDCLGAKVISSNESEMTASLKIGKGAVNKWFTTCNTFIDKNQVKMTLVDGPFKRLTGVWQFIPLDEEACKVSLELDFEFSNKLVALAFGKIFNHVANNMVKAFISRANQLA